MTYMQVTTVAFDDLNSEQEEWLMAQDDMSFVLITKGDESYQFEIDMIPLTLDEVLEDCSLGESIVISDHTFREIPRPDGFWTMRRDLPDEYPNEVILTKRTVENHKENRDVIYT